MLYQLSYGGELLPDLTLLVQDADMDNWKDNYNYEEDSKNDFHTGAEGFEPSSHGFKARHPNRWTTPQFFT